MREKGLTLCKRRCQQWPESGSHTCSSHRPTLPRLPHHTPQTSCPAEKSPTPELSRRLMQMFMLLFLSKPWTNNINFLLKPLSGKHISQTMMYVCCHVTFKQSPLTHTTYTHTPQCTRKTMLKIDCVYLPRNASSEKRKKAPHKIPYDNVVNQVRFTLEHWSCNVGKIFFNCCMSAIINAKPKQWH